MTFGLAPALMSLSSMTAFPFSAAKLQRRDAFTVGGRYVRARGNQQVRAVEVVQPHGPMERRRAVWSAAR